MSDLYEASPTQDPPRGWHVRTRWMPEVKQG